MTSNQRRLTDHARRSTGSYDLMLSSVAFGLFGFWLDRRLGITPALMITFTVLGFVGAGVSIYYRYRADIARLQEETAVLRRTTAEVAK